MSISNSYTINKGTGNQSSPTVSSGGSGGRSTPIIIENIITLDGHVIDKRIIQKYT